MNTAIVDRIMADERRRRRRLGVDPETRLEVPVNGPDLPGWLDEDDR